MAAVRIALLGTFDVDNYGDHLFPRVAVHELRRRLPDAVVAPFSPYGWLHPTPLDDGRAASPLGPWSPRRASELAAAHHLVVIGGGELIHLDDPILAPVYDTTTDELTRMAPSRFFVEGLGPELEAQCPVVWHGVGVPWVPADPQAKRLRTALSARSYVTVRDRHSAQRLVDAGVDRPVDVVPDSALLLDRIMPAGALSARLARLRAAGGYPGPDASVLVVQGCELLLPHVDAVATTVAHWLAEAQGGREVVILETGRCRGDARFANALEKRLARQRLWRLAADATVEDLASAVAGGQVFLGSSLHGAITALAYGRPFVLLNLIDDAKLDGFGDLTGLDECVVHAPAEITGALDRAVADPAPAGLLGDLQKRIDRHFDQVAELAAKQAAARPDVGPVPSIDTYAVADQLGRLRAELDDVRARLARAEAELTDTRAGRTGATLELDDAGRRAVAAEQRAGAAERELGALLATRSFRLLAPARRFYGWLRRNPS